jgi:hypothetical protein
MATKKAKRVVIKPKLRGKAASTAKATPAYARYLRIVLKLPSTEESTSYGTPSVKVAGKILSRLRTEAEGALAIHCDFLDREMLLQADPDVFLIADHYKNYPMILVRLEKISVKVLPDLVERAWRMRAPKKLLDKVDIK